MSSSEIVLQSPPPAAVASLIEQGIEPLAARVLAARGITKREQAFPPLRQLPLPHLLPGVSEIASALAAAIRAGERICVVGDYDVDGITSTVMVHHCLRALGADSCRHIPVRSDGYGLSPAIVEAQAAAGVRHLLTVDNGITAHTAIAHAHQLGLRVYVTDHHQPDAQDNQADILVNPVVNNGGYDEFNNLAGVGLAFYLMAQLRSEMNAALDVKEYLDLVALGTIADCAVMDTTNRALSGAGLALIRSGKAHPGILALLTRKKIKPQNVTSREIAFRTAPLINAAGRMDSAEAAVRCLLADDLSTACSQAEVLYTLNSRRLYCQDEVMSEAMRQADPEAAAVVVYESGWHSGVVGIVAGKIADHFQRPAFVFHQEKNRCWRGSGRAPAGYDLMSILKALSAAHPALFARMGGHARAASATCPHDQLEQFSELFNAACRQVRTQLPPSITAVDSVNAEDITSAALRQLERVVWGIGFPAPLYRGNFFILETAPLPGGYLRLQLSECASGKQFNAVYFGGGDIAHKEIDILYRAEIDSYNRQPKIIIEKVLRHQ